MWLIPSSITRSSSGFAYDSATFQCSRSHVLLSLEASGRPITCAADDAIRMTSDSGKILIVAHFVFQAPEPGDRERSGAEQLRLGHVDAAVQIEEVGRSAVRLVAGDEAVVWDHSTQVPR